MKYDTHTYTPPLQKVDRRESCFGIQEREKPGTWLPAEYLHPNETGKPLHLLQIIRMRSNHKMALKHCFPWHFMDTSEHLSH